MPESKTPASNTTPNPDNTNVTETASGTPVDNKATAILHGMKSFGIGLCAAVAWVGAIGAVCYVGARATARGYKDEGVDMNTMYRNHD